MTTSIDSIRSYCQINGVNEECVRLARLLNREQKSHLYGSVCSGQREFGECLRMCDEYRDDLEDTCVTDLYARCQNVSLRDLDGYPECACFLSTREYGNYLDQVEIIKDVVPNADTRYLRQLLIGDLDRPHCFFERCQTQNLFPQRQNPESCNQQSICIQDIDLSNVQDWDSKQIELLQNCVVTISEPEPTPTPTPVPPTPIPPPVPDRQEGKDPKITGTYISIAVILIFIIIFTIIIILSIRE